MRPFSLIFRFLDLRSSELAPPSAPSRFPAIPSFALACFALLVMTASPSSAETVVVVGPFALNGADGATGTPGQPGQNGGPGGSATAIADANNQDNTAEATGARGGNGGAGGAATIGSGADGGPGGNGGNGGSATATATTTIQDSARAVATGGFGGSPGARGNGSLSGMDGPSGSFGNQGNATAQASIDRESLIIGPSAGLQGDAIANGGNAAATVSGIVGGPANPIAAHRLEAQATSFSGNAVADAMGRTSNGDMVVRAESIVERASSSTFNVNATAAGTNSGTGSLTVSATSTIRRPSTQALEAAGRASASGISTGGGDVQVSASVIGGSGVELRNAVSGSTSGLLRLSQGAHSTIFRPGFQQSVQGTGVTRTELTAENTGGGPLVMVVGGTGYSTTFEQFAGNGDGDVILGDIHGRSTTGSDVTVRVVASGYQVFQQNLDDPTSTSQIRGTSNGGDVSISTDFRTGNRISTNPFIVGTEVRGLDGPDIVIDESVSGDTTGNLEFIMQGRAGSGGNITRAPGLSPPGATYRPGNGGSVTQRLTRSGSFESLSMNATSTAGFGGSNGMSSSDARAGRGGSATTALNGTNDAGGITLIGNALARDGGAAINRTGNGGDATIDFRATTSGDNNAILLGNEREQELIFSPTRRVLKHGAWAGDSGGVVFRPSDPNATPLEFGAGGRAESRSEGLALGDSTVTVYDFASGGNSSRLGGDASSSARAEGAGLSSVLAQSKAAGGAGANDRGGNATSFAYASGLGEASASALAISGPGANQTGKASAIAEATGGSGMTTAEARTVGGTSGSFRTMLSRSTSNQTRLEATVGDGLSRPTPSAPSTANSGFAFLSGRPLATDVNQLVQSHAALGDFVAANPGSQVQAIGGWEVRGGVDAPSTQMMELDITLDTPESGGDLALVFSNLNATGGGFETLLFRLEVLGEIFGEEVVFNDLASAVNYFSSVFLLGQPYLEFVPGFGVPGIRATFEVTTAPGQSIEFGLAAVVVPEPSTAIMLGFGLLLVATSRRREATIRVE